MVCCSPTSNSTTSRLVHFLERRNQVAKEREWIMVAVVNVGAVRVVCHRPRKIRAYLSRSLSQRR
jgi:hypothetical protein